MTSEIKWPYILTLLFCICQFNLVAQSQMYIVCSDKALYSIDPSNCSTSLIGYTSSLLNDIAYNPIDETYYAIGRNTSLYTVDVSTALITPIGMSSILGLNALTFDKNGTLYAMGAHNDSLYTLNTSTGIATNLGSTATGIFSAGDLTHLKGDLYLSGIPNFLIKIDPITPFNSSIIGRFSNINLAFGITTTGCSSNTYAFSGRDVHLLNQTNILQSGIQCINIAPSDIYGAASTTEHFNLIPLLGKDTSLCNGEVLTLELTTANASYLWQDSSTNPRFTITQSGDYWVEVLYTNSCKTRDSITVNYKPPFIINLGPDTVLCQSDTFVLDVSLANTTYLWQDGSINPTFTVSLSGQYWVETLTNGCIYQDTINISYLPSIDLNLGNDTTICNTQSIFVDVTSQNSTYQWQDGSNIATYEINKGGIYYVIISNDCETKSDSISVIARNCECQVYIPNSFTPNGDRLNDNFIPKFNCDFSKYILQVFNRWGEKVFETTNPYKGWDGTFQNVETPQGSYVYIFNYESVNGESDRLVGKLSLIR